VLPETTSDRDALELAITENLQREDLHPLDEATAFGRMQRELGYSYAQIAERLGKSKGYVQNRMRLLQLDAQLQQLVLERPETLSHVYELAKLDDDAQRQALIEAVLRDGLSFTETRTRVQALLAAPAQGEDDAAYLRRYESEENHNSDAADEDDAAYLRRYESEENHNPPSRRSSDQRSTSGALAAYQGSLTPRERAALVATAVKVERYLDDLSLLTEQDWAVLSPLALRLSDLLRQVGRVRDAARNPDSPDT
jgi:ParB family transcriptional regulator, chromosome partitioning protein